MPSSYTPLANDQLDRDRPFTHPGLSLEDMASLRYIAGRLRALVAQFDSGAVEPRLRVTRLREPDGRVLRLVICNGAELRRAAQLSVVGFFGHRRYDAEQEPIARMDEALLEEFLHYPDILAYCSLELEAGDWANLVLMAQAEARQHWAASQQHAYAANELAPRYYATIRLHNADLPGGLAGETLTLIRTKYFDYQNREHWRGLRELYPSQHYPFA